MGKIHELLAVEADRHGKAKLVREEAISTFKNKGDHFIGHVRELKMFDEESQRLNTTDRKEIVTTVPDKLEYVAEAVANYVDVVLQKESANQEAKSDLVVKGKTLATGLPTTFLLGLETKLAEIRAVYEAIPTLDPGVAWQKDTQVGKHVYATTHPEETFKTAKTFKHKVLTEATQHHPAQIEKWEEQLPVGRYILTKWSGKISPAEKAKLIGRIDDLIHAAKVARAKGNNTETKPLTIGKTLFDYINS